VASSIVAKGVSEGAKTASVTPFRVNPPVFFPFFLFFSSPPDFFFSLGISLSSLM
jgi:hypothetical protein